MEKNKKKTSNKNIIESQVEPGRHGVSTGLVVVLMFLMFIIGGMTGYIFTINFVNKYPLNFSIGTKTNSTDETKENKKEEEKSLIKDDTKEIVYTYIEDRITDNGETYTYRIPQINIDSSDVNTINQSITEKLEKDYKDSLANYRDSYASITPKIDYKYFQYKDVLSVLTYESYDYDVIYYEVYNINVKTGKKVTNTGLLDVKNFNTSEFNTKLVNAFKTIEPEDKINSKTTNSEISTLLKETYQKNVDALTNGSYDSFKMFLNTNGELCVVFDKYNTAGNYTVQTIINVDTNTYMQV